jgi:hypothetical protein
VRREEYLAAIGAHYRRMWGAAEVVSRLPRGPVAELPAGFVVHGIRRGDEMMAYCTVGMSEASDDEPLELHLLAPPAAEPHDLVELLHAVAHYHRTGHRLGLGHSVSFGRPYVAGSTCEFGLISLPYLDGPRLEWMDAPEVRFLWLLPITAAEREYKKQHGTEALEQRLEAGPVNYLDPRRRSLV